MYTHRTQGVGAEGAHIKGMYEAFRDLGHEMEMNCLPGCNPVDRPPAGPAGSRPARRPLIRRILGMVAERAPQIVFEAFEIAYNLILLAQLGIRLLRFRPHLVYERYSLNTFAPSLLCRLLRTRHVLEVNDSVVIERSRPLSLKRPAAVLEGYCLRSSDLSITITSRFKELIVRRFGLDTGKVMVLTNGVSRRRFDRPFDRGGIRKKLGLGDCWVIGSTGQFLPWHGLQDLVRCLGDVAAARDIRFLFIGDGPARKEVMEAAEAAGIGHRVLFTGMIPIEEVPDCLSALDLAVIPSAAAHASPMKLIEYMAVGLPVVAPDLPSIKAAIETPELGVLFPSGDMDAMRAAVLDCLENPGKARAIGTNSRRHVMEHLTWTRHAEAVLGVLK